MSQLIVKNLPTLWIPDEYQTHLADDVWETYELVVRHHKNWYEGGHPIQIPFQGPFEDQLEEYFQKFASWNFSGNREAYQDDTSEYLDEWTQNAYEAFGENFYADAIKILIHYRLSFYWSEEGYKNMPWKEVW